MFVIALLLYYTDEFYSDQGLSGLGDDGPQAIRDFCGSHVCCELCIALKLRKLSL